MFNWMSTACHFKMLLEHFLFFLFYLVTQSNRKYNLNTLVISEIVIRGSSFITHTMKDTTAGGLKHKSTKKIFIEQS